MWITFLYSQEPLGKFQPNLAQNVFEWRRFKLCKWSNVHSKRKWWRKHEDGRGICKVYKSNIARQKSYNTASVKLRYFTKWWRVNNVLSWSKDPLARQLNRNGLNIYIEMILWKNFLKNHRLVQCMKSICKYSHSDRYMTLETSWTGNNWGFFRCVWVCLFVFLFLKFYGLQRNI